MTGGQPRSCGGGRIIDGIPETLIRAQLARIIESPIFKRALRMQRFLSFLCEERLAGRGDQLKEYTIAIGVFDKPADFDPGTSAVIRVEAGRLRRMLEEYRAKCGADDKLAIDVPKGTYIPSFSRLAEPAILAGNPLPVVEEPTSWPAADEQRLVTVLSCAISDDRTITDGPVDRNFLRWFELLQARICDIAARHGGKIESRASDRVLMHFGWPEALEDSAGSALAAALEIIEISASSPTTDGLGLKIGVATSGVVILAGSAESRDSPRVIGPAPLVASTISTRAPLNAVLVADSTRRLAGHAFQFVPAGAFEEERDQALHWRLLGRRAPMTRFRAERGANEESIIGRRDEIGLLLGKWQATLEGESQLVGIVGEAGIGKSILAEAAVGRMADASVLRLQCSPHHTNSSLYPFVELLRHLLPLNDDVEYDELASRFLAPANLDGQRERGLLAGLLSRLDDDPVEALPASRQKDLTLNLLARWVAARAEQEPVLLLIEDLHWSDPTTVELLQEIARSDAALKLMMLLTSRKEIGPSFCEYSNLTALRLARLPKSDCEVLITRLASAADVPAGARDAILRRAEGIPLFIEELTRLCLGSGAWRSEAQVPSRLSDLLCSQLGRLGSARGVAQVAAVMGRRFSSEMLALALGRTLDEVDSALDRLQAAGIVTRTPSDEQESYQFRHALLRDAAYESILDQDRRELHRKAAAILVESLPETAARHPELVAGHLMDAGDFAEAFPFWVDAGEGAARRYALAEASTAYRLALEALSHLPASSENSDRELDVLIALGQVVRSAHGYGHEDLLAIYSRTREIAARKSNRRQLANSVYGLWTHAAGRGKWPDAVGIAAEFEVLTRESGISQLDVEAQRLLGASAAFRGQFKSARNHFTRAMEIYKIDEHGPDYGFDPGAASAAYLAWVLWHLGEDSAARENARLALSIAEAKEHAPTLAMVLSWVIFHSVCERDSDSIAILNDRLQAVCAERECRYWQPFGSACVEWANFEADRDEAHLQRLVAFTKAFRERYFTSSLLLLGAEICLRQDRPDQAITFTREARQFINDHDERLWEAEADRLTSEALVRLSPDNCVEAQRQLARAIETARRQGAVALEDRASAALSGLQVSVGASTNLLIAASPPHVLH